RVDREDRAGEVVRADQTEAVFNQLAIAPLAVAKRVARFVPGCGNPGERCGTPPCRSPSRRGWPAAFLLTHGPTERGDYTAATSFFPDCLSEVELEPQLDDPRRADSARDRPE